MSRIKERLWHAIKRPHSDMHPQDIEWLGINNVMRTAKLLNTFKFRKERRMRDRLYRRELDALLRENGNPLTDHGFMKNGVLIDTSGRWPHLAEMMEQCEQVIERNGMTRTGAVGREWIRDIMDQSLLSEYPALLDFITSTDVLKIACDYLGYIPTLSTTVPPGMRLTESHQTPEVAAKHAYARSQLFHVDFHDKHMVYVIVLLRDVNADCGPFCFFDSDASARIIKALGYGRRGRAYRLSDDEVFSVVDRKEMHVLTGKAGTVLFMDPSKCFHYGSRDVVVARYQAMYALLAPNRADFTEWYLPPRDFPVKENDSRLRRLVLEKAPYLVG